MMKSKKHSETKSQGVPNRFGLHDLAFAYHRDAPHFVPVYQAIQVVIIDILENTLENPHRILDLGAGSGRFILQILKQYPTAVITAFDNSEAMRKIANHTFKKHGNQVQYYVRDMSHEDAFSDLNNDFHFITSSHAIHHLTDEGKRALYRRVFTHLIHGGLFIHADEVMAASDRLQLLYARKWDRHLASNISRLSPASHELWQRWRQRNIVNYGKMNDAQNDLYATLEDHLEWLKGAGFSEVECYWKHYNWAVFGGLKPEGAS